MKCEPQGLVDGSIMYMQFESSTPAYFLLFSLPLLCLSSYLRADSPMVNLTPLIVRVFERMVMFLLKRTCLESRVAMLSVQLPVGTSSN